MTWTRAIIGAFLAAGCSANTTNGTGDAGAGGAPVTSTTSRAAADATSTSSGQSGIGGTGAETSAGSGGGSGGAGGAAPSCDLYVASAPAGGSDCSTPENACSFAVLWEKGSAGLAGKTTCVLGDDPTGNGHFTGTDQMLTPPAGVTGSAGQYIRIVALQDGAIDIDGEQARRPMHLGDGNDYFWIEGLDVHSSGPGEAVVSVSGNHNVIRRIVAWDARLDFNTHVFSISGHKADDDAHGYDNLLEDDAAFGIGRKMFETFESHGNTFRRCWARWEGSINTGPKRDLQINYHSYNTVVDDFIARWDGHLVPDSYILMNNGAPYIGSSCAQGTPQSDGSCRYDNGFLQEADGAVGEIDYVASIDPSPNGNDVVSGVLALIRATDVYQCSPGNTAYGAISPKTFGGQTFRDVFVYIEPGTTDRNKGLAPVGLGFSNPATDASPSSATNVTSLAQGVDTVGSKWTMTNYLAGHSLADLAPNETLYMGSKGAHLCHRHQSGTLTAQPLWPWPMSQRIHAATLRASTDGHHHAVEDVDGVVQSTFGPFPAECRTP